MARNQLPRRRQTAAQRPSAARRSATTRRRLRRLRVGGATDTTASCGMSGSPDDDTLRPPPPPVRLTPQLACDPETGMAVLWYIAEHAPELRRWIVANPKADAALLEYIAQSGGPGVNRALGILLTGLR